MNHYDPKGESAQARVNVKKFVEDNMDKLWEVFIPLAPYIAGLYLLDAIISDVYFSDSKNGFGLFGLLSTYFSTVFVISWHRIVIHGPDNYVPMDPFAPKKHELVFIGMGFLIGLIIGIIGIGSLVGAAITQSSAAIILAIFIFFAMIYLAFRCCLYFPAKATNADLTMGQAFHMSKGYLWRIIWVSFRASVKWMLLLFAYLIVMVLLISAIVYSLQLEAGLNTLGYIFALPSHLFFSPIFAAIGVTTLSNYYLYIIQKDPRYSYTKEEKEREQLRKAIDDEGEL
ncbi:MAG: hypothetical protein ACRBDL_10565 [Alphaproteobacteria bacterium]